MARQPRTPRAREVPPSPPTVPEVPETRRARFERLATPRVNRALTSIRLLGNLASSNYEWDEADVFAIRAAIETALEQALSKFERGKKSERPAFVLPPKETAKADNRH